MHSTDREKSCGYGAWRERECKQSIDYSWCWAECLGLRLLANLIVPLVCLSTKVMPKLSPGKQTVPEASGNGQGTRYMFVLIPAAVYYPGLPTRDYSVEHRTSSNFIAFIPSTRTRIAVDDRKGQGWLQINALRVPL